MFLFLSCFLLVLSTLCLCHSSVNMNEYREDRPCCYFHPKEVLVGVCPLCLNERLLILASKQGHLSQSKGTHRSYSLINRKPTITLPKIFTLGTFLNRLEFRHKKFKDSDVDSSSSIEDSFISIKFEDNGVASWEKNTVSKVSVEHCTMPWNDQKLSKEAKGTKSVVEHAKPRGSLRWRKRIGHFFQLIRWKRTSKGNVCHVGSKLEGVKVRNGWIRSLTKRRTKQ
ncbi:hypothetical protein F0562_002856 [Nyssa sinensis]|uniref:Uncharacterized protein n=1 Tax=Nyssa sinensis TaxID=561372 RepID=A0A5J5BTS5_9ASTE|nr:hypothetical protein F0562_002856 [Nyssa sinensis]